MSEDIKREETQQPISDEELDEASGGFGAGQAVTRLPYRSQGGKPAAAKLPYSGQKPKVTRL